MKWIAAQGGGSQPVGITIDEMKDVVNGWSAKN